MENIKTWRERADERGIGSCEARDEELIELRAENARLQILSVTNILLDVVPRDGAGLEIYAKSVSDVTDLLAKMELKLEEARAELSKIKQQEPVAQILHPVVVSGFANIRFNSAKNLNQGDALYLAAGAAKTVPLTREQVLAAVKAAGYEESQECADFINGMRHCELAHGITEVGIVNWHMESRRKK